MEKITSIFNCFYLYTIYLISRLIKITNETVYLTISAFSYKYYKDYTKQYNLIKNIDNKNIQKLLLGEKIYLIREIDNKFLLNWDKTGNIMSTINVDKLKILLEMKLNDALSQSNIPFYMFSAGILINTFWGHIPWLNHILLGLIAIRLFENFILLDLPVSRHQEQIFKQHLVNLYIKHNILPNRSLKTYILREIAINRLSIVKIIHKSIKYTPNVLNDLRRLYRKAKISFNYLFNIVKLKKTKNIHISANLGIVGVEQELFEEYKLHGYISQRSLIQYASTFSVRRKIYLITQFMNEKTKKLNKYLDILIALGLLSFAVLIFSLFNFYYIVCGIIVIIALIQLYEYYDRRLDQIENYKGDYITSQFEATQKNIITKLSKNKKLDDIYNFELMLAKISQDEYNLNYDLNQFNTGDTALQNSIMMAQKEDIQEQTIKAYEAIKTYLNDSKILDDFRSIVKMDSRYKEQEMIIIERIINKFEAEKIQNDLALININKSPRKVRKL